jgi:CRP-like cAMP-binding protein
MTFEELEGVYRKWLNLDADPDLLRIVISVVVANRIDGAPVWAILIGPSGSGKTSMLLGLEKAEEIKMVSTLTPASLASGYQMDGVNDSLLFLANGKVMVIKDMSTVLSLYREARDQVFSMLRDAYDGSLERATGKGMIIWKGKFGILTAATPALEAIRQKEPLLGERFMNIRTRITDSRQVIASMLASTTKKFQKQEEIADATAQFLGQLIVPKEHSLPASTRELVENVARALVKLRTGVDRDWHSKEIQFPVEIQELPTRLMGQLTLMALAFKYTGANEKTVERMLMRLLNDGIPYIRLKVLQAIMRGKSSQTDIGDFVKVSQPYMNRVLDEMRKLDIIRYGSRWTITDDITKEAIK